jgi:hypothetical protein
MRDDDNVDLDDVLLFIKNYYKTVLLFGVFGVFISVVYLAITPNIYEARQLIVLARIVPHTPTVISGSSIEGAKQLIDRITHPSSITKEDTNACGSSIGFDTKSKASIIIQASTSQAFQDAIEISVLANSSALAFSCAEHYFVKIRNSQDQLINTIIKNIRNNLDRENAKLAEINNIMQSSIFENQSLTLIYILSRVAVSDLIERINSYENIINNVKHTHRFGEIKLSSSPVLPNNRKTLVSGLAGGLLLGLLLSLAYAILARSKRS